MAKTTLLSKIRNNVHADSIGKNKLGQYVFRYGYFYRNGMDSDKFAARIAADLAKLGVNAKLVDSYDHWAPFRGGASLANSSHFAAIFEITE